MSPLNRYFDKILVINLRRSVARCLRVTEELRRWGIRFEIMNAVDGGLRTHRQSWQAYLDQSLSEKIEKGDPHPLEVRQKRKLLTRLGEWGYLLTWKVLLRRAIQEGWKRILVFEDDVRLCQDFNERATSWLHGLEELRPLVMMLGATQLPKFRGEIKAGLAAYHPKITDGSFAVGLDSRIFPELLEQVMRMDAPFDSGPLRTLYQKYPQQCYTAWPHLVIADLESSTIRAAKTGRMQEIAQKLEWNLDDFELNASAKINISLTLYDTCLTDTELKKALQPLISPQREKEGLFLSIFLIRRLGSEQSETLKPLHRQARARLNIYPKNVATEGLARVLGEQYWNRYRHNDDKTGDTDKTGKTCFYNTEWRWDRELLWTLPMLDIANA